MQLISIYNKKIRFLLYVINLFSEYAWVVPLKDKKGITIINAFQKILDMSKKKTKQNTFYNDNDTEMYLKYNEEKSVVAERFIRALKNKL